jgi:hypothetical protein
MIRINVQKVLTEAEQERNAPRELPRVKRSYQVEQEESPGSQCNQVPPVASAIGTVPRIENLIFELEREFADMRTERAKLSTHIYRLVENGASKTDLMEQYDKIEAYRVPLQQHYDKIAYVKLHGHLPEVATESKEETLFELKDKKRKLVDKRCKLSAKLKVSGKPSRPVQLASWQIELELATAEYQEVEKKIKQLEGRL